MLDFHFHVLRVPKTEIMIVKEALTEIPDFQFYGLREKELKTRNQAKP